MYFKPCDIEINNTLTNQTELAANSFLINICKKTIYKT